MKLNPKKLGDIFTQRVASIRHKSRDKTPLLGDAHVCNMVIRFPEQTVFIALSRTHLWGQIPDSDGDVGAALSR